MGGKMVTKNPDTKKWKATISVDLEPVNAYGDVTGDGSIRFTTTLEGSLTYIVGKLEDIG
jgi:hypothetical protein